MQSVARLLAVSQEYIDGTTAAVARARRDERQHFVPLHQPALNIALEYGTAGARAQPLAVNDSYATEPALRGFADKFS